MEPEVKEVSSSNVDSQPKVTPSSNKKTRRPASSKNNKKPVAKGDSTASNKKVAPSTVKGKAKAKTSVETPSDKEGKIIRSFPASTYEDALEIADAIQKYAAGQKIRRLTLFDYLQKSPESGISRQMLINSSRYGLTVGGYKAEFIELTEIGKIVTDTETNPYDKASAAFKLAIESIKPFNALYQQYKNSKLPLPNVLKDFLIEQGYKSNEVSECIDTFTVNAKYIGILRVLSGAERLIPIEAVLENLSRSGQSSHQDDVAFVPAYSESPAVDKVKVGNNAASAWDKICFYITPIGSDESEDRKHSNLFLESIVVPALQEFGLNVVRADQIGSPGMISSQIIEHIIKSRLVIADLSFHNPNVFYELALRHEFVFRQCR